jgi:hypothetical protein
VIPSPSPLSRALTRNATNLQSFVLTVLPHGGQRSARRNAWASMSQDAVRARAQRDADAAMELALDRAAARERRQASAAR